MPTCSETWLKAFMISKVAFDIKLNIDYTKKIKTEYKPFLFQIVFNYVIFIDFAEFLLALLWK